MLLGRRNECEELEALLAVVRSGHGGVLVVRGEAGVGKTALLDRLAEVAVDFEVVRAAGVESELELAFAALHQICGPMLGHLGSLPGPQRNALGTAFGLAAGPPPDLFLVAMATLSLMAEQSEQRRLLCLVDDAQWLDQASAQVLGFVGRRLLAEPMALVFAARAPVASPDHLAGLPELQVRGLGAEPARSVLSTVVSGPLDESVRSRIIEETRGNPLALLEFGKQFGSAELAGGFALPDAGDLPTQIENLYAERLDRLPRDVQRLLLLASAEPVGDPALVLRAAQEIGVDPGAVKLATRSGLLDLGARVRFRHPLVRSAVYRNADPEDRRSAHAALAAATDRVADPDRRAWHRSHATTQPDEEVARELVASAARAQARGGVAAAAAFWERAVTLTPDPDERASRALVAAEAKYAAGDFASTQALLTVAEVGPVNELRQARAERLHAQVAFALRRGSDAPPLLLHAAQRLGSLDADLARQAYIEALVAAIYAGRLAHDGSLSEVALAAKCAPFGPEPLDVSHALLRGLAVRLTEGYTRAAPILKAALEAYRAGEQELGWVCASYNLVAMDLWDDQAWFELAAGQVQRARASGTLSWLPFALDYLAESHIQSGELAEAASLLEEAERVDPGIRAATLPYVPLLLAAWRGEGSTVAALDREMVQGASSRGEGAALTCAEYARAVLHNGLGNYTLAAEAARSASGVDELVTSARALYELVEASSRCGQTELAADAVERLSAVTSPSGTDWALGVEASARALHSEKELAEHWYLEAIERLARTRVRTGLARAHLVYGEWLRRENRRVDARQHLRAAHDMLSAMEIAGFAERARRELLATGETVRKRSVETANELTPQEAEIARLAAEGLTNPEIGAQMFISARTVEWHLRKVFAKLGVTTRRSLRGALPDPTRNAPTH